MRRPCLKCTLLSIALGALTCVNADDGANVYAQKNLVSDLTGMAAHTDLNLVNAWGIDRSPTGPWWVNSSGKGLSIVYDSTGAPAPAGKPLVVKIPPAGASSPTGI